MIFPHTIDEFCRNKYNVDSLKKFCEEASIDMLQYYFSTVLMAFLSCGIIIVFVAICFCNKKLLVSMGYKMFALLLGLTFLRLIFPFQFSFTSEVALPRFWSRAIGYFCHPFYVIGSLKISMWRIFEFVWVIVSIFLLVKFVRDQIVFKHTIILYGKDITDDERYSVILSEVCGNRPNPFRIIEMPGLEVPVLAGFFSPCILMPEGLELDTVDLRYLLSHETAHHFHRDILTKIGINLMAIVYWWNPACLMLQGQLNAILEMRIDSYVTGDIDEQIAGYLNCLVHVAENKVARSELKVKIPKGVIQLFDPRFFDNLVNRFHMMVEKPKPYARVLHIMALILTVALYLLSYCFIFEAQYFLPKDGETIIELFDSTYAVLKEDNTYDIYFGGGLLDNVSSLENYPSDIVIYNSVDEVPEALRNHSSEIPAYNNDDEVPKGLNNYHPDIPVYNSIDELPEELRDLPADIPVYNSVDELPEELRDLLPDIPANNSID